MRVFLSILFLICNIFYSKIARSSDCGAGQYNINGECFACSSGQWSSSGSTSCNSCPQGFGNTYVPQSAESGAKSKYECYKILDADSSAETNHGPRCKNENDTDIEYSENGLQCRQYYRESGTYVSCDGNAGTDSYGNPISPPNNTGYHMEESGCYKNTRKCSKFTISSGNQNQCITSDSSHQNSTIYSDALLTWDTGTQKWQADSSCKCRVEGDFEEDYCNGFKEFYNTDMVNSSTVDAQLVFTNNSGATPYCTGCLAGYYASEGNSGSFNCVPALQGYYSTGCGTKWTADNPLYSNSNTINCGDYGNILKPCYAGMTSNSGATSVHDCRYTNQTQFCDAWGCTSYSDLVGSNADNWWWYMRESNGSSGSVDSSNGDIPIDVTTSD